MKYMEKEPNKFQRWVRAHPEEIQHDNYVLNIILYILFIEILVKL